MMGAEDKTLLCFCHWGRKNKVLSDGSTSYVRGITDQIIVKSGIKYVDFVNAVFDRLGIDPSDKLLHFIVKFDMSELIRLRDQDGINTLLQFNDGFTHVYASSFAECISTSPSGGVEKVDLSTGSDIEPDTIPDSYIPMMYDFPDPEFTDFDKHRAENIFADDQIWACYDTIDGMPRFYMHIRKVYSPPEFNVMFNWLKARPRDQSGAAWVQADLPVGCGKFRLGSAGCTNDRLTFSHQMQCEKGKRGLYLMYPKKGETWAIFKDWDIRWSSDPNNHRKYKYQVVEILSDYVGNIGVQVSYLDKMTGFVCLFQQTRLTVGTFFVKPNELYKFSHRIPSVKMNGTEREGIPAGSFELDPASLPINPDDIWYPGEVKEDSRTAQSGPVTTVLSAVPCETRDMSRNATTYLESGDLNGIHATERKSAKVQRNAWGVNISKKKRTQMSPRSSTDGPSTNFCDNRVKKSRHSSPSIPTHLACQADKEVHSKTKSFGLQNSFGSSRTPITSSDDKGIEEVFCNFRMERCMEKFQVDQVWALYGQNSRLQRTYAQVKKIVPATFKLHVVLLEACAGRQSAAQSVCGKFKVQNEKYQTYAPSSFSHVVNAVSISRNRFEIYPRQGEVWALYNLKSSGFNPDMFECEIVEVFEYSKDRIKVSSMVRVHGFKSVFRSPRKQNFVIREIQKDEFWKFSHQIPAFQLTGEKGGALRGCWELDPASVPRSL